MKLSEQLNEAILHYQQGVATAAEKKLVEDLYASFEQENTIVDIGITGDRNHLEKESLALIQARIAQQRNVAPAPVASMHMLKKLSIAAAVLIIVTAGIYRWLQPSATQPAPPAAKTDAAPGGNKAILTLGDNSTIILDSAANGQLAQQGKTTVIKSGEGQLRYDAKALTIDHSPLTYNKLTTPRGGQYQLILPDGSKVWLNAASSIRYPTAFTGNERSVEITGEVYFEVARSGQKMPFKVNVNDKAEVEVLGTHFNINAYEDEDAVRTTLLEGKVKVVKRETANGKRETANPDKSGQPGKREKPNKFSAVLKPGEQAVISPSTGGGRGEALTTHHSPFTIHNVDVEQAVAWVHGEISMKNITVKELMRQISRWYDVDVVFEGEVPNLSFSGSISKTINLSLVLKALNDNGLHASLVNGKLIVKK